MAEYQAGYLERFRTEFGEGRCRQEFIRLWEEDQAQAAAMLEQPETTFATLFALLGPIAERGRLGSIGGRARAAAEIALTIVQRDGDAFKTALPKREAERPVYEWMLKSGGHFGADDAYLEIKDVAASVLLDIYRQSDLLPEICEMIFARARRGLNIHYLVWAFFRVRDPKALALVAERLDSFDQNEVRLAHHLLGLEDERGEPFGVHHAQYAAWLAQNDPFLYFTDESMQYASSPAFAAVDLDRKYLNRENASYVWQPIAELDGLEQTRLEAFHAQAADARADLSDYSHGMHRREPERWRQWIALPVAEQLRIARMGKEELV